MSVCQNGVGFGVWDDGVVTLCFHSLVLVPLLTLSWLVAGGIKGYYYVRQPQEAWELERGLRVTLACCVVAAVLQLARLVAGAVLLEVYYSDVVDATLQGLAFVYLFVFLMLQASRGRKTHWTAKLFMTGAFMLGAIRVQTLVRVLETDSWRTIDVFDLVVPPFTLVMATIALFSEDPAKQLSNATAPGLNDPRPYQQLDTGDAAGSSSGDDLAAAATAARCRPANPEQAASQWSRALFWWINPLLALGYQRPLQDTDLWDLAEDDQSRAVATRFQHRWRQQQALGTAKASVVRALAYAFGFKFALAGLLKLVQDMLLFVAPVLLQNIIAFVQGGEPWYVGIGYVLAMLAAAVVQSLFVHRYFHIIFRSGMLLRSALISAIYHKSFVLSNAARQTSQVGEIVNLMSIDTQRLADLTTYLHMVWSGPLQITIAMVLLYDVLGVSVFGGVAVMVLLIPVNMALARRLAAYQKAMMAVKDRRIKIMNEVLQGMRVVKFFNWEVSFLDRIGGIRAEELDILWRSSYFRALTLLLWSSTPVIVSVVTFTLYTVLGNTLTASSAFTALALFNILRFPMNMLPSVLTALVEARVSVTRIQNFLLLGELDPDAVQHAPASADPLLALSVRNGDFSWSHDAASPADGASADTLADIQLQVPRGSLVAVVGGVGAGKSSLLAALLGEIPKTRGDVRLNGSVAFCPQQAWTQNATLRNNVLFGRDYDEARYQSALSVCELAADLAVLPAADQTEIGEKGINLSGGQKQRVSLARAVYADADVYLLDDPLSAVDAHVGRAIFDNCIRGALRTKTRILVTHQLQYLSEVDKIIVLRDGRIAEIGTYAELLHAEREFSKMVQEHVHKATSSLSAATAAAAAASASASAADAGDLIEVSPAAAAAAADASSSSTTTTSSSSAAAAAPPPPASDASSDATSAAKAKPGAKLMTVEERDIGQVDRRVYMMYFAATGGLGILMLVLLVYTMETGTRVAGDWWLSFWSAQVSKPGKHSMWPYLLVYVLWGLANNASVLARALLLLRSSIRASHTLHSELLQRVMRAPMLFFDTTPVGRILNRFSKDIYSVDEGLPRNLSMALTMFFSAAAIIVVISLVTPVFMAAILPLAFVYRFVQQYYLASSRELKRLDSISRSPIYAHFGESLSGLSTIRSYALVEQFESDSAEKVDRNQRAYYANASSNRWLGVHLELLGNVIVALAALFVVMERDYIDPGLAGLSISYALSMTGILNWLVRVSTDVENEAVSVERIKQYIGIAVEAPPVVLENRPPPGWPHQGAIEFRDYQLRYREGLDLVLRGLSCQIRPGEKIGIAGRTGAGKSSLMLALYRLVEPAGGQLLIDGIDVAGIGLDDLRSHLSIIPQEPVLFTGTLRSNLDPFGLVSESDMLDVLERVHLRDFVAAQPKGLDSPVAEYGENLSAGQRQLIAIARALLRKTKILLLDEATASVDYDTDQFIQKTLRDTLHDKTVLTIAHRINTILDSDRVMVLQNGRIVEFDTPAALLANTSSLFYSMASTTHNDSAASTPAVARPPDGVGVGL